MVDIATAIGASTLVFVVATLAFLAWTRRLPAACRRYGYAATAAVGVMAIAYVAMTAMELFTGGNTDLPRFLGYTGMWIPIVYVTSALAGVGRRLALLLLAIVLGRVWITLVGYFLDGIAGQIASLLPFALLIAGVYLLYGPFTRVAASRSGDRSLLFTKLKHLIVLGWIGLVINGLIAADGLGLVDDFVALLTLVYVEAILLIGFAGLVLRNVDALEAAAEEGGLLSSRTDADLEDSGRVETAESTEPVETAD